MFPFTRSRPPVTAPDVTVPPAPPAPPPASSDTDVVLFLRKPATWFMLLSLIVIPGVSAYLSSAKSQQALAATVAADHAQITEWKPVKVESEKQRTVYGEQIGTLQKDFTEFKKDYKDDMREMRGDIKTLLARGAK